MDDTEDENKKDKLKKLPGQMCYDEIEIEKEIEKDIQSVLLKGQLSFDDTHIKNQTEIKKKKDSINIMKKNEDNKQKIKSNKIDDKLIGLDDVENEITTNLKNKTYNSKQKTDFKQQTNQLSEKGREHKRMEKNNKMEIVDGIVTKTINDVFHESMIPYTEHVVMDRALPRVEDGLKPVQRRILYSMLELGVTPDKQYRKSARIVGDCMGKYHPHGDSSVYDAMVRMSQNFSLRETLVDGHGNFGSVDGDSAAAMRYTEAKLTPLAMELLRDLDKNVVHWSLNFDDTLKEPDMLPGRFPNLLVNGATGIAVGVATNIPPHNLGEVIDGVVAYIDNPKLVLTDLMKYIKAPDFPTGGILIVGEELMQAYRTGKGKIIIRANVHFENEGDKQNIVITELPYQVNKAQLLQKIAELKDIEKDKLACIGEIRDETDRNGMRAVIKIKKDGNAKAVLDYLYKQTNLQMSYGLNMVAIADGKPKQMGLLDIVSYYVEYQRQIIFRRTKFELDEAKDRCHIVEGLLVAITNIDEVIKIIKKSESVIIAKTNLKQRFNLSEKQAQAILDMRLARLVNLEKLKLEQELAELREKINRLTLIYNSKERQLKVVKSEILEIKKQFSNPRRSKINSEGIIEEEPEPLEDAFAKEVFVAKTAKGNVKRISVKNYNLSQKDITENSSLADINSDVFVSKTNEKILAFTNKGNVLKIDVGKIPECKWHDDGFSLKDLDNSVSTDEKCISLLAISSNVESKLYFYTKKGMIKCSVLSEYLISKSFYQSIKLKDDDELICVEYEKDDTTILFVSEQGMTLRFSKNEVPTQSRISQGVMAINIDENDNIVFASQVEKTGAVVVVTDKCFAKKVPIGVFDISARYRKGLRILIWKNNGEKLVFAGFSAIAQPVAVLDTKFKVIEPKQIPYDNRTSAGKQVYKKSIKYGFYFNQ